MMYLQDLVASNGHNLIRYNQGEQGRKYMTVFDYSKAHGGTFDGFRYYNGYYVDITK